MASVAAAGISAATRVKIIPSSSWPGSSRPSTSFLPQAKTWMPGTRPGMTKRTSLPPAKLRLAPLAKGRDALRVVLAHGGERVLVAIHVACEIIQRMSKPVDGQLRHRNRDRRLPCDLLGERHGRVESLARLGHLLHQSPLIRFLRRDALIRQDHRLLGARDRKSVV